MHMPTKKTIDFHL